MPVELSPDYCARQRDREDFAKFHALIATPGNLATGVVLPANAQVYISSGSVLVTNNVLVQAIGRTVQNLGQIAGAAGRKTHVGKLSPGTTVIKAVTAPGTVQLYIRRGLGHLFLIAQG